jgi:hypothetical protein
MYIYEYIYINIYIYIYKYIYICVYIYKYTYIAEDFMVKIKIVKNKITPPLRVVELDILNEHIYIHLFTRVYV